MVLTQETEPFFARHYDRVVFSKDGVQSTPVDIVVRYNRLAPDIISGEILGTRNTYDVIEPVFNAPSAYCTIASARTGGEARLSSTSVLIRSIGRTYFGEHSAHEALKSIGDFTCDELAVDDRRPHHKERTPALRTISFHLTDSTVRWGGGWVESRTSTEFKIKPQEYEIAPGFDCPFTITAETVLVFDDQRRPTTPGIRAEPSLTLRCRTTRPPDSYADATFAAEAKELVNDILLLMSFVSRVHFHWHTCEQDQLTVLRALAGRSERRGLENGEAPVDRQHTGAFLTAAIPALRSLRQANTDLKLPILYLVESHVSPMLDTQLAYAILCLERLADIHGRAHGLRDIVAKPSFKAIRAAVSDQIAATIKAEVEAGRFRSSYSADEVGERMNNKLSELNRLPLWDVLQHLCSHHGVTWQDLYPRDTKRPTFIETRNKFIHSSDSLDGEHMMWESIRIRIFCERIIAKMLGWAHEVPTSPYVFL